MFDQPDHDFWDRLVTHPTLPPPARTTDDRIILAIDGLLPDATSARARARARAHVLANTTRPLPVQPTGAIPLPKAPLMFGPKTGSHRRPARTPHPWAAIAATLLLVLSAIAVWWTTGSTVLPHRSLLDNSGIIPAPSEPTGNVSMLGIDPGRTNAGPGPSPLTAPTEQWSYFVRGTVRTAPVVVDGVAYFGQSAESPEDPGAILAVRASDGAPIWTVPTGHGLTAAFLLDQGTLYAVDDAGIIYAIDALTGTEKWTIALHEDHPYSLTWYGAPLMLDGKLIFSSGSTMSVAAGKNTVFVGRPADDWIEGDPHVYAVSPTDGSIIWDVPGFPGQTPQGLIALSIDHGSLLWSHSGSPAFLGPAYADGTVYYGEAEPTALVALDAQTGIESWRTVLAEGRQWDGVGSPAITSDAVLAGLTSGSLVSLDRHNGQQQWTTQVFSGDPRWSLQSGLTVAGNQAIAIGNGAVAGIDLTSHEPVWHEAINFGYVISTIPVAAGGTIFLTSIVDASDRVGIVALADASDSS
jgi:outer membrane protein assembly factor BamB